MELESVTVIRWNRTTEQLLNIVTSDRRHDPKLGKMSADGVDHRGLLANEQVTGTVQR
jgi:hypothetical protein